MRSLLSRRPSPAIVISSVALFMSLGGVGYAATQLPYNSVGANQLRNHAVTYKKIMPNAVGRVRANMGQIQARIWKTCGTNMAMTGAQRGGDPKCTNFLPATVGTTSNTADVPTTATAPVTVTSANLPAGERFMGLANPTVDVQPGKGATGPQTAVVACTLTVGSNTQTRTITVTTPSGTAGGSAAVPLQLTGSGGVASVACTATSSVTPAPTVSVTSAVDAIQIQ